MTTVRPIRLPGRWRYGFALDYHTVSSTYLGDDEYGHPMFDTRRSDLGELLYRLKYRSDASVLDEIVQVAARFYRSWNPGATVIVPVPPSRSSRPQQPVSTLAAAVGGQLSISVEQNAITRTKERSRSSRTFTRTTTDCEPSKGLTVSPCPPSGGNGYCFWTIFTGPGLL